MVSMMNGAPRPPSTAADPPGGCGPAWERPGARPARGAPRPMNTSADPPGGCGPAWERPGARPAVRLTPCVSFVRPLFIIHPEGHLDLQTARVVQEQLMDVPAGDRRFGVV